MNIHSTITGSAKQGKSLQSPSEGRYGIPLQWDVPLYVRKGLWTEAGMKFEGMPSDRSHWQCSTECVIRLTTEHLACGCAKLGPQEAEGRLTKVGMGKDGTGDFYLDLSRCPEITLRCHKTANVVKTIDLYTMNEYIFWYIEHISIQLFSKGGKGGTH